MRAPAEISGRPVTSWTRPQAVAACRLADRSEQRAARPKRAGASALRGRQPARSDVAFVGAADRAAAHAAARDQGSATWWRRRAGRARLSRHRRVSARGPQLARQCSLALHVAQPTAAGPGPDPRRARRRAASARRARERGSSTACCRCVSQWAPTVHPMGGRATRPARRCGISHARSKSIGRLATRPDCGCAACLPPARAAGRRPPSHPQ